TSRPCPCCPKQCRPKSFASGDLGVGEAFRHRKIAGKEALPKPERTFPASRQRERCVHFQRGICSSGRVLFSFRCLLETDSCSRAILAAGRRSPFLISLGQSLNVIL